MKKVLPFEVLQCTVRQHRTSHLEPESCVHE
jgi:hypothetical protein